MALLAFIIIYFFQMPQQLTITLTFFLMMTRNLTFGQFTEFSADYKDNNVVSNHPIIFVYFYRFGLR